MPSTLKASKELKSSSNKATKLKGKAKLVKETRSVAASSSEDEDEEDEESDDAGVDEEGMNRLMQALGDDALDEFDQAQLQALEGDEEDEEEDEDWETDGGGEEASESGEENSEVEDDEESLSDVDEGDETFITAEEVSEEEEVEPEDIPLDDVDESVDEDAVPRQKVEIDNKVRTIFLFCIFSPKQSTTIDRSRANSGNYPIRSLTSLDRDFVRLLP